MKHHPAAWIFIVAAVLCMAFPSLSVAEERFGPWLYYAPYYYPPNMVFAGRPLVPQDFAPKYESPNPPQPSNAAPPCSVAPQKPPVKVSSRGAQPGMRGSGDRSYGKSSISTPYVPPRRSEGAGSVPAVRSRNLEPVDRAASRPAVQETSGNPYLPPAKPTPQLSSPGSTANEYRPAPQPTAQPAPRMPANTFQPSNMPPNRTDAAEIPSVSTPSDPRPSLYSSPVGRSGAGSVREEQPPAVDPSGKKGLMWGRQSPRSNQQGVTPPAPRSGDQNL
jgi:hypothetical protein